MTITLSGAKLDVQPRPLAGIGHLLRFAARRDRVRATVWIASLVGLTIVSVASITGLYDTPTERLEYAALAQADAALKAIAGPGYGLDDPTTGAIVMNEILVYTFIGIALMCIFLMIRHTRAEEETDRAELVRAARVGRLSTLVAAVVWVTIVDALTALGIFVALVAFDLPTTGSLAFASVCFGIGLVFIGVAATTAQIASSARAATATAGAVLGVSFIIRAVGDLGTGWLTWLSPLGWAQSIRAFADERWWVLVPLVLTGGLLITAGTALSRTRDLGAGLRQPRPGPAEAARRLATPFALAVRMQRGAIAWWTLGVAFTGFFFGIVADQADELLENEAIAEVYAQAGVGTPTEAFLATTVLIVALITSGYTVSSVLRLRSEELAGRAGATMSTPVSRRKWMLSTYAVALLGTTIVMIVTGLAIGAGYSAALGETDQVGPVLGASLAILPALFVLAGVTVVLVGLHQRWSLLAWLGVVVSVVAALLAETLDLPQWMRNVSPFEHLPALPAASFDALPFVLVLGVALVLTAVGVVAIGRRDIAV